MGSVIAFFTAVTGLIPIRLTGIFQTCKWILSHIRYLLYKTLKKDRLDFFNVSVIGQPERVGFLPHPVEEELESPHSELHLKKADDGILFYGVNTKGDFAIISISRLCSQKAEAEIHLRLASGKVYDLVKKSDFQNSSANKNAFTCGDLQAYYLKAMRTWRIFFSGYLKETSEEDTDLHRMTYVKFSFLWRASSDVYDSTSDLNKTEIVKSVAKEEWENIMPPTHKLFDVLDFYAQTGAIMGTILIDEASESQELYLFGGRLRFLGNNILSKEIEIFHVFGYVLKNGMCIHFGQASIKNITKGINYGFVTKPTGSMRTLQKLDFSMKTDSNSKSTEEIKATVYADRKYMFSGSVLQPTLLTEGKEKWISKNQINFFVDGNRGIGIYLRGRYSLSPPQEESVIEAPLKIPECVHPMVLPFTDDLCQLPEITGGKGSSLGKLSTLSRELNMFTVPPGVVVTTSSYKHFITPDILSEIKHLEDVLYGNKEGDPKEVSKIVCEKIITTKLPSGVLDNIVKNIQKIFGDDFNSVRFAVRSSATGEDTEQMSAAGQMDTFLGITGLNNILTAVKKCWASQFGFIAIQYKRRYGQCLNTPMAVVIQEMVACDVAGVIFTCDPISGNGSRMSIAANYGLGESVVSATVDPDTIVLQRDANDEVKIHSTNPGQKSQKVTMTSKGTISEDIPEDLRMKLCLSSEDIIRLGNLAIKIEKYYRSKRDIEWGFKDGKIFLFQSRPVTSGTDETDFEIEHELDAALRIENDYFSVSNVAEVLPGAMTYLSKDLFFKQNFIVWQGKNESDLQSGVKGRYFDLSWFTMYNHAMFSVTDLFHQSKSAKLSGPEKVNMMAFFGRILLDIEEIVEIACERFSGDRKSWWTSISGMLKNLLFSGKHMKDTQKYYANYRLPLEKYETAKDLFYGLATHCCDRSKSMKNLVKCSQGSAMWNMMVLTTLSQDKEEIDSDAYADFSKLVTSKGNVESADVPAAIERLAADISESIAAEKFKAMNTEDALEWLKETSSLAGKRFSEFLTKHGHRCIMEYDVYSTTWESDPTSLVQLLQNLVGSISKVNAEKNKSVFKQISELKTPLSILSKLKLLLFVPMSRKCVQNREAAKSLFVKVLDSWRKGYWELAKRMVSEGRIPDEKLLFFMTLDEIKDFLDSRSPKILSKAYHRQRLFPKMYKYRFAEIMKGIPRPINENEKENIPLNGSISMQGIPVSPGVAKGFLRVAVTINEASSLQPGEILLAYSTDIGWTPYFPCLAGVATELGGLISHGAVVSREYGLPCVAGLHGATKRFSTGDYVLLDGNKGLLQKISPTIES